MQRRKFLSQSAIGLVGIPTLVQAANPQPLSTYFSTAKTTILFQGDSITDAGRKKDRYYANDASGMGLGYVHHIVTALLGQNPNKDIKCYNRGISGHKVFQLANRWEDDCLQIQPDILSILIGVNDFWHTLDWGYKGTAEVYEKDFRALLERTQKALPKVKLIIAEPFVLRGTAIVEEKWYPAFSAYQKAAKSIANDFGAAFIPLQAIFDKALEVAPVSYWCPDGVHPSLAGGYLMAEAWKAVLEV
ncbi:MAG: SGNH/GDSL hydrolase family protein [Saprospiraceae bacterium]